MRKLKYAFSILLVICMLCPLAGCDGNTESKEIEKSERIELSPTAGGTIGIFSYKPDTLCPIFTEVSANLQMLNLVFDGLIEVGDTMEAQPCLAESWYSSENGRIWTISLRRGVHWHDGSDFTAEDVVFTVNQIRASDKGAFKASVASIASISAEGSHTVKIELSRPSSSFINMLYFPIVKNSGSGIDKSSYTPVGTGAFSFHDENEGGLYRLRRNDDWWGGKVYLSGIDVNLLPEKSAETYMFSSGEIDIATSSVAAEYKSGDKDSDSGKEKDAVRSSGTKILSYETSDYSFLGINHKNSALKMQTVRQAISYAVNRADIAENILGGAGVVANAPINPSWSVCDNDVDRRVDYSEEKARELLVQDGWALSDGVYQKSENGMRYKLEFSLLVNSDNAARTQIAENIAKTLGEFGIKINIIKRNYEGYSAAVENGNYDLFVGSYRIAPSLDLALILGRDNVFNFEDEEILSLLNEIKQSGGEGQKELYGRLQSLFNEKIPVVGLYFEKGSIVTGSRLKGKPAPNMYNIYNGMEHVYVEVTPQ